MTHSREVLTTPISPCSYPYSKALLTPDLEANVTRGRLGKGAALAIRMREALYYGDWEVAKAKAKEIINLNVYSLEPSYQKLFTIAGQGSAEIIAAVQYLETVKPHYTSIGSMFNNSVGG